MNRNPFDRVRPGDERLEMIASAIRDDQLSIPRTDKASTTGYRDSKGDSDSEGESSSGPSYDGDDDWANFHIDTFYDFEDEELRKILVKEKAYGNAGEKDITSYFEELFEMPMVDFLGWKTSYSLAKMLSGSDYEKIADPTPSQFALLAKENNLRRKENLLNEMLCASQEGDIIPHLIFDEECEDLLDDSDSDSYLSYDYEDGNYGMAALSNVVSNFGYIRGFSDEYLKLLADYYEKSGDQMVTFMGEVFSYNKLRDRYHKLYPKAGPFGSHCLPRYSTIGFRRNMYAWIFKPQHLPSNLHKYIDDEMQQNRSLFDPTSFAQFMFDTRNTVGSVISKMSFATPPEPLEIHEIKKMVDAFIDESKRLGADGFLKKYPIDNGDVLKPIHKNLIRLLNKSIHPKKLRIAKYDIPDFYNKFRTIITPPQTSRYDRAKNIFERLNIFVYDTAGVNYQEGHVGSFEKKVAESFLHAIYNVRSNYVLKDAVYQEGSINFTEEQKRAFQGPLSLLSKDARYMLLSNDHRMVGQLLDLQRALKQNFLDASRRRQYDKNGRMIEDSDAVVPTVLNPLSEDKIASLNKFWSIIKDKLGFSEDEKNLINSKIDNKVIGFLSFMNRAIGEYNASLKQLVRWATAMGLDMQDCFKILHLEIGALERLSSDIDQLRKDFFKSPEVSQIIEDQIDTFQDRLCGGEYPALPGPASAQEIPPERDHFQLIRDEYLNTHSLLSNLTDKQFPPPITMDVAKGLVECLIHQSPTNWDEINSAIDSFPLSKDEKDELRIFAIENTASKAIAHRTP